VITKTSLPSRLVPAGHLFERHLADVQTVVAEMPDERQATDQPITQHRTGEEGAR